MNEAAKGDEYIAKVDFAIGAFSRAIEQIPNSIDYHIKRSTAYQRSKRYEDALIDADRAVYLASERGKRDLRASAQLRRSIALFHLRRIADAHFTIGKAIEGGCSDKSTAIWQKKIENEFEKGTYGEASVMEIPLLKQPTMDTMHESRRRSIPVVEAGGDFPVLTAKKINHEWYQTSDYVIVTIYAKGIDRDDCKMDVQPRSFSLSFPIVDRASEYSYELDSLYAEIAPASCSVICNANNIEIKLKKVKAAKWKSLEAIQQTVQSSLPPSYPTSSKSGPKNWDKLAAEDPIDASKEGGDAALNKLFQDLYANADDDTKKAMIKSYTESGGTSLSTNWKDVSKGRMEIKPPEGMEAKQY